MAQPTLTHAASPPAPDRVEGSVGSGPLRARRSVGFVVDRAFALPTFVLERDGAAKTLRRYTYRLDSLGQTTQTKGPYWYHYDGLGSVSVITDGNGTPLAWTEHNAV